jgi:NADPH:quinone reductase-like Zn-dependent oxidoreductase
MRAIVLRETGGPDNLKLEDVPIPVAAPGQVVINTEAIGASYTESVMRSGTYPLELPLTFGIEAAGVIMSTGEDVDKSLTGRRVVAMSVAQGCYAEYVAVPLEAVTEIPDAVPADDAVAAASFGAVALCLVRAARLTGAETVLVEVAAGGVGGYLTQLARAHGAARVIGTAGSEAKRDFARTLGADEVLDHYDPDWTSKLADIDVAFDSLAGGTPGKLVPAMTPGTGRILLYGLLQGPPEFALMDLLVRGLTLTGCGGTSWLGQVQAAKAEVLQLVLQGQLRPVIDSTLPLEAAAEAHRRFDERTAMGKIILRP